jgi:hypothetical protein
MREPVIPCNKIIFLGIFNGILESSLVNGINTCPKCKKDFKVEI